MSDEIENQNEHTECETRAAEYLAGWKRAQADYANLQREVARERETMGKFAAANVVAHFLPVYDYFKRALQHVPPADEQSATVKQWFAGADQINKLFQQTLRQSGVEEIETRGRPFDPTCMEAVKEEQREGVAAHTVIEEIEGGYKSGEQVIKPARVVVAAGEKSETEINQESN